MMNDYPIETITWLGVAFCVSQSAMFSGLNLAFFSLSRLRLEIESESSIRARRVLEMRKDSNLLLTTILWGNVGINVLLTLLTDSLLAPVSAFLFSTFVITLFGEIGPQAYFSRHALRMASALAPVLRFYQFVLYPVARPSAKFLDAWLGAESAQYMRENTLRDMLERHVRAEHTEVDAVEGTGALNFLDIDDLAAWEAGQQLAPESVIVLPTDVDLPRLPDAARDPDDPFLTQVNASGEKWVVLTDLQGEPQLVLDADEYLRAVLFKRDAVNPYDYCHRPVVIRHEKRSLGWVIKKLAHGSRRETSGVMEDDVVLLWGESPRIITGADILARLLSGM